VVDPLGTEGAFASFLAVLCQITLQGSRCYSSFPLFLMRESIMYELCIRASIGCGYSMIGGMGRVLERVDRANKHHTDTPDKALS
jgi:hypothetical protein